MGESVAENNALFLPIIYVLGGLMTAYDTYSTYQDEGAYEAVKSLMIDGVITAVGGGLFKVGGKVFTKLDDAYDYVKITKSKNIDLNKVNHIFGDAKIEKHKLLDFTKEYDGDTVKAYQDLEKYTQKYIKDNNVNGQFEKVINVNGTNITVRGNVINGEVKIGTAFIP
ncbi:hypothetical protein [Aliarcobacter butzleri]|nr:hypothetical protein [Aliarcobacter butzleri]MDN5053613.1 hypothetical protein [Aliarcobacter butzleri]